MCWPALSGKHGAIELSRNGGSEAGDSNAFWRNCGRRNEGQGATHDELHVGGLYLLSGVDEGETGLVEVPIVTDASSYHVER